MKSGRALLTLALCLGMALCWVQVSGQVSDQEKDSKPRPDPIRLCAPCIRGNLGFLSSDALRGRGSATEDEHRAAIYVASRLKAYGVAPAGEDGGYLERAPLTRKTVTKPPQLRFGFRETAGAKPVTLTHGTSMVVMHLSGAVTGPLQKIALGSEDSVKRGAVVFLDSKGENPEGAISAIFGRGAALLLFPEYPALRQRWKQQALHLPRLPPRLRDSKEELDINVAAVDKPSAAQMQQIPDGTEVQFSVPTSAGRPSYTWNALGKIRGSDPGLEHAAILFSAHLDHLGVGKPVNGDSIYNGADDDASGTAAVLELARVLGKGPKPRRTVIFALFGSEEIGGLGSTYFREHPPVPLEDIAANLEFEMIGRPDPAVKADTVWLTGWERSNLGPALAEHGAHIVSDPHPGENFFARSDNFVLAKKGVVAQTISSYGLHKEYHQPNDDLAHIDFKHMNEAIGSLLEPVCWLVDSDFVPQWNPGGKP